jgi:hypothetical protein
VTSAERTRGCIFREGFSSPSAILNNGGAITGALNFNDQQRGCYFAGASYLTYQISSQPFSGIAWSCTITFWPTTAANENAVRYFLDTPVGNETSIYHDNTAGGNALNVLTGASTPILMVTLAAYQAYWLVGQRNVLVVAATSGANKMWLNGVEVGSSATAWTPQSITNFYLGATNAGATPYQGYFQDVKFFRHNAANEVLTVQEAADLYNNRVYNYLSKAACVLPMTASTYDPSHIAQPNDVPQNEICVDGNMEAVGIAAWTALGAGAVVQKAPGSRPGGTGTQVLQVIRNGAQSSAYQTTLTVGRRYRCTGWARGDGASTPRVTTGASSLWTGTTSTTWQYLDLVFTTTHAEFHLFNQLVDGTVEFDDFSVVECVELLSDGLAEATDVGAWTVGAGAVITKSLVAPYQGTQSLQVAFGAGAGPYASQFILTVGRQYHISGVARGDATYLPTVQDSAVVLWTGTTSTTWQAFSVDFTATTIELRFRSNAVAAGNCGFDAVSVVEVIPIAHDASGKGKNFRLGNGTTATTFPAKRSDRGFDYDGGDYLRRNISFGLTDFTVALVNTRTDEGTTRHFCCFARDDAATQALAIGLNSATGPNIAIMHNNGASSIDTGIPMGMGHEVIVWTFTASTRVSNIYLNGVWRVTTAAATVANGYNGGIWLGASAGGGSGLIGSQRFFALFPFVMTATQIADISAALAQEINVT